MQDLVGIVRMEDEMREALRRLEGLQASARARAGVEGHREYHTGWHTCLDLRNLLTVSEAITQSAIERKESRGGHFRDDYPDKVAEFGDVQHRHRARRRTERCRSCGGRCRRCRPS